MWWGRPGGGYPLQATPSKPLRSTTRLSRQLIAAERNRQHAMTIPTLPSDYTILALETSCDETAAAVVRGGREIIANVVASQIDEHRRYGGIVPEVASRQHILALPTVVEEALAQLDRKSTRLNSSHLG